MPSTGQLAAIGCLILLLSASPALADRDPEGQQMPRPAAQGIESNEAEVAAATHPPRRLRWRFRRVHPAEGAVAGALAVAALPLSQIDVERRWAGQNAFDDWFRHRLVASADKQSKYAHASDALVATSVAFPMLVDLVGLTLIGDRNKDVGLQMFVIQAQALAISGFVANAAKLSGRQRPCATGAGSSDVACSNPNRSYFGAHTAFAFTAAGLTCVEQQHLQLLGRIGGPVACSSVLAVATLVGAFRMAADRHWMTDELTGAGVGLLSGWLMPWLMHYRHDIGGEERSRTRGLHHLSLYGKAGELGLRAAGIF